MCNLAETTLTLAVQTAVWQPSACAAQAVHSAQVHHTEPALEQARTTMELSPS